MSGRLMGRLRPALAVGVLSLALVTACSSGDDADTSSSTPSTSAASESSAADTSPVSTSAESGDDSESAAAPSAEESGSDSSGAETTGGTAEPSEGAADPSGEPAAPSSEAGETAGGDAGGTGGDTGGSGGDDATEGTTCNGLTVAGVNAVLDGVTLESAIDTTIDDSTGESSCIFGTTTTIDTIAVDRYPLDSYLGGELAGMGDTEVLDAVAESHVMSQTEVESADNAVGRLTARTLTGTDLSGGANALSYTVQDGTLVAVSVSGPAFADSLADTSLAVLELALG